MNALQLHEFLKKKISVEIKNKLRKLTAGKTSKYKERPIRGAMPKLYAKLKALGKAHGTTFENMLYLILEQSPKVTCPSCDNFLEWRGSEYAKHCSSKCSNSNEEKKKKFVSTSLERFGCENPSQNEDIKQMKKETCLQNFGVEFPQQSKKVRAVLVKNNLHKYGKRNVGQVEEFKNNRTRTMLERYGSENAMGNAELRHKASTNSHSSRSHLRYYVKLGKRVVETRGYEPYAIDWLLDNTTVREKRYCGRH